MFCERGVKVDHTIIKGFEVMYMFKKGQLHYGQGLAGEIRLMTNCLLDF